MRRLLAWAAGAAGGLAAYRALARLRGGGAGPLAPVAPPAPPDPAEPAETEVDPRAAELRAKLDATREPDAAEPEPGPGPDETPEERRARVHERGRSALDEMHGEG